MTKPKTLPGRSLHSLVVPPAELQRRVKGREIELHFQPLAGPVWARNSVYVRGDERDRYTTCLASGHGGTMAVAVGRALRNWLARQALRQGSGITT